MLITESQINYGRSIDAMSILNTLPYIQESVSPSLVPVVESTTRGQHIVDLQSLVDFNESSGINDLGYALHLVCESSGISDSNVVFSVQEESIIEDSSLASLCESMLDDGLLVYAKPISMYDTVSLVGEACLDEGILNGNWSLMEAFTDGNFGVLLEKMDADTANYFRYVVNNITDENTKKKVKAQFDVLQNDGRMYSTDEVYQRLNLATQIHANSLASAERMKEDKAREEKLGLSEKVKRAQNYPNTQSTTSTVPSETGGQKPADTSQLEEKVKELEYKGMNAPRRYISKAIAWLHRKAAEYNNKIHNKGMKDGSIKWYQKILSYITRAIESLTRRLHNFVSDDKNQLKEYDRTWDFKKK